MNTEFHFSPFVVLEKLLKLLIHNVLLGSGLRTRLDSLKRFLIEHLYAICTQFHDNAFSGVSETTIKLDKNCIYVSRSRTLLHFSKWFISERVGPKRMLCTKVSLWSV